MPTSLHKAQSSVPADSIPLGYNTPEEATFLMIYPTAKTDVGPVKFLRGPSPREAIPDFKFELLPLHSPSAEGNDAQTGMPPGIPEDAMCVQKFNDSRVSAIHITYRNSLHYPNLSVKDMLAGSVSVARSSQSVNPYFSALRPYSPQNPKTLISRKVPIGPILQAQSSTTSFLTATTLIYAIGAGITAAAGTRLALQLFLVKGRNLNEPSPAQGHAIRKLHRDFSLKTSNPLNPSLLTHNLCPCRHAVLELGYLLRAPIKLLRYLNDSTSTSTAYQVLYHKKRSKSFRTTVPNKIRKNNKSDNKGLISADRNNKATLLLTIPRSNAQTLSGKNAVASLLWFSGATRAPYSYPCGNFSGTSSLKFRGSKGSIGHTFMVCIHTENQNQGDFYPFVLLEISVLHESPLGHLRYRLTDVPPQPNSPPDNVFNPDQPVKDVKYLKVENEFHSTGSSFPADSAKPVPLAVSDSPCPYHNPHKPESLRKSQSANSPQYDLA
ncbi:hypothetical protein ACO0SA_004160 [Hanseniaspora valbyensis]